MNYDSSLVKKQSEYSRRVEKILQNSEKLEKNESRVMKFDSKLPVKQRVYENAGHSTVKDIRRELKLPKVDLLTKTNIVKSVKFEDVDIPRERKLDLPREPSQKLLVARKIAEEMHKVAQYRVSRVLYFRYNTTHKR